MSMSRAIAACAMVISLGCQRSDPLPVSIAPVEVRTYGGDNSIITEMKFETVLLLDNSAEEARYYCTGVWINKDTILTARHCIVASNLVMWQDFEKVHATLDLNNMPIEISMYGSRVIEHGISAESDAVNDLALIIVPHTTMPHMTAQIAQRRATQGDDLHFMGHPDEFTWTYTKGVMAADRFIRNFAGTPIKTMQISGFVYHGNSGGGAFDAYGDLVGLCSSLGRRAPGQAHYIPIETIRDFLDEHHVSYVLD